MKIGLLEKKVESTDTEIGKRVSIEREEVQRIKENMDEQERYGAWFEAFSQGRKMRHIVAYCTGTMF